MKALNRPKVPLTPEKKARCRRHSLESSTNLLQLRPVNGERCQPSLIYKDWLLFLPLPLDRGRVYAAGSVPG
jgi:hypothetical protein